MAKRVAYKRDQVVAFLKQRFPEVDWSEVAEALPPVVWRTRWDQLADRLGLPYTRKHMQNLDCQGQGPANVKV